MGNSPGDLEDYFDLVYRYDGFMGTFVWEWCDHSVYMGMTPEGKENSTTGVISASSRWRGISAWTD